MIFSLGTSLGGEGYAFVIIDDYSCFTCVLLLSSKEEAICYFTKLHKKIQKNKVTIAKIRSDHEFEYFCEQTGIQHEFHVPRTPQQNKVFWKKE